MLLSIVKVSKRSFTCLVLARKHQYNIYTYLQNIHLQTVSSCFFILRKPLSYIFSYLVLT